MNILLIGNGFDLAHELPTRYFDFLNFLRIVRPGVNIIQGSIDKRISDFIHNHKNREVKSHILNLFIDNPWFNYFDEKNTKENKNWCDFESDIEILTKQLEKLKVNLDESRFFKLNSNTSSQIDYTFLSYILPSYIKKMSKVQYPHLLEFNGFNVSIHGKALNITLSIDNEDDFANLIAIPTNRGDTININFEKLIKYILKELDDFTKAFELYISYFIEHLKIKKIKLIYSLINLPSGDETKIINFNYTNTALKYLAPKSEEANICFIHGRARTDDSHNIVLGIDEKDNNDIEPTFTPFRKYFQRALKSCDRKYRDWVNTIEEENQAAMLQVYQDNVAEHYLFIIGHSLTLSDRVILKELITLENMNTIIIFHDEANKINLMQNLAAILGYKEFSALMERESIKFELGDFQYDPVAATFDNFFRPIIK